MTRGLTSWRAMGTLPGMAARKDLRIRWPFRKLWHHPLLDGVVERLGLDGEPVVAGWGYRPSGKAAIADSRARGGRLLVLEDALVRSMKPGEGQVYGLVADSRGIYYDASGQSDLVKALNAGKPVGWMRSGAGDRAATENLLAR